MMHASVSATAECRFTVGRNRAGSWIIRDARGLVGGVFVDRNSALHFAMAECGYDPSAIAAAPEGEVLTLDDMLRSRGPKQPA